MEGYVGEIRLFGGNFAPKNWAYCDGAILPINGNQALFAITGDRYGGNGQTDFALPDLKGRSAVGAGEGPGLSNYNLGEKKGVTTVALDVSEIPEHTHLVSSNTLAGTYNLLCNASEATTDDPSGAYPAIADSGTPYSASHDNIMGVTSVDVSTSSFTCSNTGGSSAHNNMQPYLVTAYIICIEGDFPMRN